jgi:hypothetical protein
MEVPIKEFPSSSSGFDQRTIQMKILMKGGDISTIKEIDYKARGADFSDAARR